MLRTVLLLLLEVVELALDLCGVTEVKQRGKESAFACKMLANGNVAEYIRRQGARAAS